jgi:hypothetical protein
MDPEMDLKNGPRKGSKRMDPEKDSKGWTQKRIQKVGPRKGFKRMDPEMNPKGWTQKWIQKDGPRNESKRMDPEMHEIQLVDEIQLKEIQLEMKFN